MVNWSGCIGIAPVASSRIRSQHKRTTMSKCNFLTSGSLSLSLQCLVFCETRTKWRRQKTASTVCKKSWLTFLFSRFELCWWMFNFDCRWFVKPDWLSRCDNKKVSLDFLHTVTIVTVISQTDTKPNCLWLVLILLDA